MNGKVQKNQKNRVEFKLLQIKKIYHFERDLSEYNLTKKDIKNGQFEMVVKIKIDGERGKIFFGIKADFTYKKKNGSIKLFGIESLFKFQVKRFKSVIKSKELGKFTIPDPLMVAFLNIALSGTRGMLAALNTDPVYGNVFIPLTNPTDLYKSFKDQDIKQNNRK